MAPDPGGAMEHKGEKHWFAVHTLSVKDDSKKRTRGVHVCGCQKGSFRFPHLGQMRSSRIEIHLWPLTYPPLMVSLGASSHRISSKLLPQAFYLWSSSKPTISLPIVHGSRVWGHSKDGKMWGPAEISVCLPPPSHPGQHMPSCSGHPAQIKVHRLKVTLHLAGRVEVHTDCLLEKTRRPAAAWQKEVTELMPVEGLCSQST